MCCARLAENTGHKKLQKNRHLGTIAQLCSAVSSQLRQYRQSEKIFIKKQYVLHMCSQYGELQPTNGWDLLASLGTPANFNWFRVLPSLLQRRRSPEANQTLHDVGPSPGLVQCIHFQGLLPPDTILPGAKFTLRTSLPFFYTVSQKKFHLLTVCNFVES